MGRSDFFRARLGALVVAVLLPACQHVAPPAATQVLVAPPPPAVDRSYPGATLVIGSALLLAKVAVVEPRFRQVGRMTEAQVTVQNLTDDSYRLEYKFDWTDAQGFVIDDPTVWHQFVLTPRQIQSFASTGKKPEAKQITFTVRFPQDAAIR